MNHGNAGNMTIDTTGQWWTGDAATDIAVYLIAYRAEGSPVHETRICQCPCGSEIFRLDADRDEGAAQRFCAACGASHLICDSAEYWPDARPEPWSCTGCGCDTCNLGAGFSFYTADKGTKPDVRWLSLGQRCSRCGILGSFADWKIGYGPSYHLLEQA